MFGTCYKAGCEDVRNMFRIYSGGYNCKHVWKIPRATRGMPLMLAGQPPDNPAKVSGVLAEGWKG